MFHLFIMCSQRFFQLGVMETKTESSPEDCGTKMNSWLRHPGMYTTCHHSILRCTTSSRSFCQRSIMSLAHPAAPTESAKTSICFQISAIRLLSHLSVLKLHTETVGFKISLNEGAICTHTSSGIPLSRLSHPWVSCSAAALLIAHSRTHAALM